MVMTKNSRTPIVSLRQFALMKSHYAVGDIFDEDTAEALHIQGEPLSLAEVSAVVDAITSHHKIVYVNRDSNRSPSIEEDCDG